MRFTSGQSVGRYVIESLLGEGGMGEVYRARDSRLERAVALKVLRNDTDAASEDWEHAVLRMQREAQAVAALSHPGIVAIYDIGEQDGVPFIAMELVGGQPLRDLIGRDSPQTTRLHILLDVAKALGAAHEAGFVHRDIKPENILVRQDGAVKILDFGIARKTSRHVDQTAQTLDARGPAVDAALLGMTADGALVGTPAYMSPEQLRGEAVDARSDQFAWGVVAYEFLSGKHPFQAEAGAVRLMAAILGETPEPLENVPTGIQAAIMRALEKEPEQRWSSMQEIVMHCEALITGPGVLKISTNTPPATEVSPSQTGASNTPVVRASRARWIVAPVLAVLMLAVIITLRYRQPEVPTISPVVLPSANPQPSTTAVTDLPLPASSNATAIAEYRQGMQNIRDARWAAAAVAFHHARMADPGMAAAHLRYAIIQFPFDVTTSREAYRKAMGLRGTLSDRDQGFLQAHEPVILREPPDLGEAIRRMEALSARYPQDAELVFWLGRNIFYSSAEPASLNRAVEEFDRCVELDPKYADCWQMKSNALLLLGRHEDASKTLDECIKISENGVDCVLDKIDLESIAGHCGRVVELARQLRTKEPVAQHAAALFAQALYTNNEQEVVVRNAYAEAEQRAKELGFPFGAHEIKMFLAVNYGEFSSAIELANYMRKSLRFPNLDRELGHYWIRAALYTEMGKKREAAHVAEEFFSVRALRGKSTSRLHIDTTVLMHAYRLRAGQITPAEYQRLRTEWLDAQPRTTDFERARVWLAAYGVIADSPETGREAVEAMPPISASIQKGEGEHSVPWTVFQGRVLALAGKYREAISLLENSVQICTYDDFSLWQTQNRAVLGIAKEATGDKPGACQAYGYVLSRWGKSKESQTAKEVGKRAKKLGCEGHASQVAF